MAVCGPGGFGKTTLATQVCHQPRVVDLFSEILWVETGEDCTAARVVELISDLCVHVDGTRPALTDGLVRVWHAPTGDPVTDFANPAGWARTVAVDPPGKRLAVGSGAGEIYVRDIAGEGFTAHLPGHTGRVLLLGFTRNSDRLVSAAADGTARIWSLSEQRQLAEVRLDASLQCAAFHAATGRLLAASAAGVAMVTVDVSHTSR